MFGNEKKRVLCFGDSNTWGTIGKWVENDLPSERFDSEHRWPGVLQTELGADYEIIEEGLGGRSTIYGKPGSEWKSGENALLSCLHTHRPLDLVILMLGTNDLQINREITADDLPVGITRLVDIIQDHPNVGRGRVSPRILVMAPVEVRPSAPQGRVMVYDKFRRDIGRELSLMFPGVYKRVAEEKGCFFMNAQEYACPGFADGVHIEADGHIRLGKAVARFVKEEVFSEMNETRDIILDGSESSLYMRFEKKLRSAQGMDIYGDRAYILYDTGYCAVHDLKSRNPVPVDLFKLGSYNDGIPAKDYLNHANSCMFGTVHHENNPLPLLYVTIGTGIGYDDDGFFYRCAVENITSRTDDSGKEHFTAETLQVITFKPDGIENVPFDPPCWGCPAFFVDTEKGFLYIFSAKYRTKKGCTPEGEHNAFIITKFNLPKLTDGSMVRLTPADIIDQFSVESDVAFTQGGLLVDDKIIYTYGCPKIGYPLEVMVFDLVNKTLAAHVTNLDEAFYGEEVECCGLYEGKLLCNTCDGSIFELRAKPFGK